MTREGEGLRGCVTREREGLRGYMTRERLYYIMFRAVSNTGVLR